MSHDVIQQEPTDADLGNERIAWINVQRPRVLPAHWHWLENTPRVPGYGARRSDGMLVIFGGNRYDGKKWLHVSFSFRDHIPTYDDMRDVKDLFLREHKAIQVLPPAVEHVNIHPHCLHLWACIDGDLLPNFLRFGGI